MYKYTYTCISFHHTQRYIYVYLPIRLSTFKILPLYFFEDMYITGYIKEKC